MAFQRVRVWCGLRLEVDRDELRVLVNQSEAVVIYRQVWGSGRVAHRMVFPFGVDGHDAVQVDVVMGKLEEGME